MKILVTGCAGFIGFHVCKHLLKNGKQVIGIDNLNNYYSVSLKQSRLDRLLMSNNFIFFKQDIADKNKIDEIFQHNNIEKVINLAAQAGVRYSIENPWAYINSNISGFLSILEACRHYEVKHLVYASSSSVYGANTKLPYSVEDNVDHPLSLYAATKKSNELMAHSYSHLYQIPTTGLRFFTVYGPWGRPDMSPIKFVEKIIAKEPIQVYNYGKHTRDFTYIDDIVSGIIKVLDNPASKNSNYDFKQGTPAESSAPFRVYNIGNNKPVELMVFINALEKALKIDAIKELLPLQLGDVQNTHADVSKLIKDIGYKPDTDIHDGINQFVEWYRDYYQA